MWCPGLFAVWFILLLWSGFSWSMPVFGLCEKRAFSAPEKAQRLFEYHEDQISHRHKITVDLDLAHLKESVEESLDLPLGMANSAFITVGYLSGEKFFLKEIEEGGHSLQSTTRELAVFRTLTALNVPTLFKGVGKMSVDFNTGELLAHRPQGVMGREGHAITFMVSRFQAGATYLLDRMNNMGMNSHPVSITAKTHKGLKRIKTLFLKYHILPRDLQVMISQDGWPHIIDPELFEFLGGQPGEKLDSHWQEVERTADLLAPEDSLFLKKLKGFMSRDKTYEDLINFYFEQLEWPEKEHTAPDEMVSAVMAG